MRVPHLGYIPAVVADHKIEEMVSKFAVNVLAAFDLSREIQYRVGSPLCIDRKSRKTLFGRIDFNRQWRRYYCYGFYCVKTVPASISGTIFYR